MSIIERSLASELLEMAQHYPVITVIGPRQSGKTTLVRSLFKQKSYTSLENPDDLALAIEDPRGFLNQYPNGAILDEIQRAPQLLSYIQGIVDEKKLNGMYILTGSHQLELHETISQSLAGRTAILKLLPLSLSELAPSQPLRTLDQYLYHGMYPRTYSANINPTKFYRDYVQTYLERDIRKMINLKDLSQFQKFIKLCAGRIGQLFNANNLSNELGVSNHTIQHWLSILEASFVVFRLPPYFENLGKRITKSSKLYFTDTGLAAYLLDIRAENHISRDPLRGNLAENFIVTEFMKNILNLGHEASLYFYRDSNQNEIDLIFKSGNELVPIEIKSSQTFNRSFLKGLDYFKNLTPTRCHKGFLVYAGKQEQTVGIFKIVNFKHIHGITNQLLE